MVKPEHSTTDHPRVRLMRLLVLCALVAPVAAQAMSPKRAFLYSLLVPGWGQYAAGNEKSAGRFMGTELGLWGGFFAFKKVEDYRVDNYRSYAAQHAQARTSNKNSQYFDDLVNMGAKKLAGRSRTRTGSRNRVQFS